MRERAYRSVIKTVSWRVLGTVDTMVISFLITGSMVMAASIGSIEVITKMVLYYWHERAWNRIEVGRVKPGSDDYQI